MSASQNMEDMAWATVALHVSHHYPGLETLVFESRSLLGGATVLDALEVAPVAGKKFRPVDDVVITHVTIHANPFAR